MKEEIEELRAEVSSEDWIRIIEIAEDLVSRGYVDENRKDEVILFHLKKKLGK